MELKIFCGPMFSGKTLALINILDLPNTGKKICLKPMIDNRYSENCIVSHDGKEYPCTTLNKLMSMKTELLDYSLIAIDEAQFFPDVAKFCHFLMSKNANVKVFISMLNSDFRCNAWSSTCHLLPYVSSMEILHSKCHECDQKALHTYKTSSSKKQVHIGGSDVYVPLCSTCFFSKKK